MYLFFFKFFPHVDYYRAEFPVLYVGCCWLSILNTAFLYMSVLNSPSITPVLPHGNHKFLL